MSLSGRRHASAHLWAWAQPEAATNPARLLVALLLAGSVVGCTNTDEEIAVLTDRVAQLEREVADATEQQQRIEELETELRDIADRQAQLADLDRIEDSEAQLVALFDALTVLEEDLAVLDETLAERGDELRTTTGDLRSGVDEVRGGLDEVRADNDQLRALIETVRDRLDRCQADGSC